MTNVLSQETTNGSPDSLDYVCRVCLRALFGKSTSPSEANSQTAGKAPSREAIGHDGQGAAPPSESSGMTNGDVIKLVQAGIGESVVMTAVRTAAKTMFQLDADNLIALKKAGVSDNIVAVMLDPKAGIYIDLGDDKPNLVPLEPTVFRRAKPVAC